MADTRIEFALRDEVSFAPSTSSRHLLAGESGVRALTREHGDVVLLVKELSWSRCATAQARGEIDKALSIELSRASRILRRVETCGRQGEKEETQSFSFPKFPARTIYIFTPRTAGMRRRAGPRITLLRTGPERPGL